MTAKPFSAGLPLIGALAFSVASGLQASVGPVHCQIMVEPVSPGMIGLFVEIETRVEVNGKYQLTAARTGASGTAQTAQSGALVLDRNGKTRLAGPVFSADPEDGLKAEFRFAGPKGEELCTTARTSTRETDQ